MVEYTWVTHVLLLGGGATAWAFTVVLLRALDVYFQSLYWILTSAVP